VPTLHAIPYDVHHLSLRWCAPLEEATEIRRRRQGRCLRREGSTENVRRRGTNPQERTNEVIDGETERQAPGFASRNESAF